MQAARVTSDDYRGWWRRLWIDHVVWTRAVIVGILDGAVGTDAYVARLLRNPGDMAAVLLPFYGAEKSEAFAGLMTDHLAIAAQILKSAKAGNDALKAAEVKVWNANADAIARAMDGLNSKAWPYATVRPMLQEHLDATLAEATGHATGDWAAEIAAWEKVQAGAFMMADAMSNGIIAEFPGVFAS